MKVAEGRYSDSSGFESDLVMMNPAEAETATPELTTIQQPLKGYLQF